MIDRFDGDDGRRRLIAALRAQQIVMDDPTLAEELSKVAALKLLAPLEVLIEQDHTDNDLYLIIDGELAVLVNGREVARRVRGHHVGELAVIDPRARRSASVVATRSTLVAAVSEPSFATLADRYPQLWRRLAVDLGDRLRQRNDLVDTRRESPVLFIGSSAESLPVANEIQTGLRLDSVSVRVWSNSLFGASHFPIEDLERQLADSDFAVLVAGPDDLVTSRGDTVGAPRDNVIFELGLAMGILGRSRTYILLPRGSELKLPSDLLGLTPLEYVQKPHEALAVTLAPVCSELRRLIGWLGTR